MTLRKIVQKGFHTTAQIIRYGLIYTATLCATEYYAEFKNSDSPINSQEDLTKIVSEERKILTIPDSIKINSEYYPNTTVAYSAKLDHNLYTIHIGGKSVMGPCTRGTVKHELYHIADGHCDQGNQALFENNKFAANATYFLYWEPQAAIYSAFDIKL